MITMEEHINKTQLIIPEDNFHEHSLEETTRYLTHLTKHFRENFNSELFVLNFYEFEYLLKNNKLMLIKEEEPFPLFPHRIIIKNLPENNRYFVEHGSDKVLSCLMLTYKSYYKKGYKIELEIKK